MLPQRDYDIEQRNPNMHWSGPHYSDNGKIVNLGLCYANGYVYNVEHMTMSHRADNKLDVELTLSPYPNMGYSIDIDKAKLSDIIQDIVAILGDDTQYPKLVFVPEPKETDEKEEREYEPMSSTDVRVDQEEKRYGI